MLHKDSLKFLAHVNIDEKKINMQLNLFFFLCPIRCITVCDDSANDPRDPSGRWYLRYRQSKRNRRKRYHGKLHQTVQQILDRK